MATVYPKAFFFDFDGTLVDSVPILKEMYMKFMEQIGQRGTEAEFKHLNGPNLREIVHYLKEKYSPKDSEESMKEMFSHLLQGLYAKKITFFPGVREFLTHARKHKVRLIVVTSADPEIVAIVCKKYGMENWFERVFSSKEVANGKPHPEVYLSALEQSALKAADVIAFEDSENGILASSRAGIETIRIANGHEDWPQLLEDWRC